MAKTRSSEEVKALYDAACKKVLSEKGIAAHILKGCMEEYKDVPIEDIIHKYIQGKPEIDRIMIQEESVLTRIGNEQTEDSSEREGTVFYDIRFSALAPSSGDIIKLIINIEAQNDFHPGYPLLKRGIYYCSRMISSQYGTVFVKSDYGKIKKVYSIWVCTNPSQEMEYSITRYKMTEENLVGMVKAHRRDYDLLDVVMVCLGRKTYKELTGLLSLLNLVLIDNLGSNEKRDKLSKEFNVEITPELEKGVADMCNLSAGIEKRGIERGRAEGRAEGHAEGIAEGRMKTVINTLRRYIRRQLPIGADVIADIAEDNEMTIEKVRSIAKDNGISLS